MQRNRARRLNILLAAALGASPALALEYPIGRHFGHHTDRPTGVQPLFKSFDVDWEFTYAGVGNKGGY